MPDNRKKMPTLTRTGYLTRKSPLNHVAEGAFSDGRFSAASEPTARGSRLRATLLYCQALGDGAGAGAQLQGIYPGGQRAQVQQVGLRALGGQREGAHLAAHGIQ